MTLEQRLWKRVDKEGPRPSASAIATHPEIDGTRCWLWTGFTDKDGYGEVYAFPRPSRPVRVHRLAFFLAHGRWPEPCCLHKCDHPACVRYSHLYEGTTEQNNRDRSIKGRSWRPREGECHYTAKLTIAQVRAIRNRRGVSQSIIADEFGISQAQVSRIRTGALWVHVRIT